MKNQYINNYLSFLDRSITNIHGTKELQNLLEEDGFAELNWKESWSLEKNSSYYTIVNSSSIFAFKTGEANTGFRMVGSHTDSPTFKIKPDHQLSKSGYIVLNTEVYGGPILSTWLDRVLSVAGKVFIKSNDPYKPEEKIVNIDKDLLYIPNMAIHINREINKGYEYNPQVDMLPIMGQIEEKLEGSILLELISEELDIKPEDILDFDLYLYPREKAALIGIDEDLIASGRQDNLSMAHSSTVALIDSDPKEYINLVAVFDNEEVGSTSIQGANSPVLDHILERIYLSLGHTRGEYLESLTNSFIISADMAHGVHPHHPEKTDPTSNCYINKGPVIKYAANMAYTSDSYSASVFKALCNNVDVEYQVFTNRSDARGGSTIGPITAEKLGVHSVDVGNALLGMHSIRELGGVKDQIGILKVFKEFFKN